FRGTGSAAALEDLAEQALAGAAAEEHVLAWCMVIAVAGRHHDSFDAERHRFIEEGGHFVRVFAAEQCAVDGYPEALAARQADRSHRLVEHTLLADGLVVALAAAIE